MLHNISQFVNWLFFNLQTTPGSLCWSMRAIINWIRERLVVTHCGGNHRWSQPFWENPHWSPARGKTFDQSFSSSPSLLSKSSSSSWPSSSSVSTSLRISRIKSDGWDDCEEWSLVRGMLADKVSMQSSTVSGSIEPDVRLTPKMRWIDLMSGGGGPS